MPSWEFNGFGHTIPFVVFLPAVLFPGLSFNLFYVWPFIESRVTGNRNAHNLLERPRDRPLHTSVGATGLAFFFMLFAASSTDVLANFFQVSLNSVLWFFRIAVIVVPIVVGLATWQICRDMAGVSGIGKRKRSVVVTRSAAGEYATHTAEPRPGDGHVELAPAPVPAFVEPEPEPVGAAGEGQGVRRIPRQI
jgi:ubiquinol-cytochrome c reductase cytochrome b subunit